MALNEMSNTLDRKYSLPMNLASLCNITKENFHQKIL